MHSSMEELRAEEQKTVSLKDCLDSLVEPRLLSGDDMWQCPTCEKPQEATLASSIERLPQTLVIHLKRFYYTKMRRGKISTLVDFPIEELRLADWCSPADDGAYDLYGVVNHHGGFGSGHYTAY